jgi:hypothetical protein
VATEKVLEMLEGVDEDLRSLRVIASGCNGRINRESGSEIKSLERRHVIKRVHLSKKKTKKREQKGRFRDFQHRGYMTGGNATAVYVGLMYH